MKIDVNEFDLIQYIFFVGLEFNFFIHLLD